MDRISRRNKY